MNTTEKERKVVCERAKIRLIKYCLHSKNKQIHFRKWNVAKES